MPFPRLDASSAVHSRSPSRSLPDAVIRAFSSSLTTTVFSQRSMRRFDTSPRRAAPKGQTFISCTAPRSITQLPSNLPRSWHTPVAQGALVDPQLPGHLRDRLAGLEHQPDHTGLEVRIELPVLPSHRRPPQRRDVSTLSRKSAGTLGGRRQLQPVAELLESGDQSLGLPGGVGTSQEVQRTE